MVALRQAWFGNEDGVCHVQRDTPAIRPPARGRMISSPSLTSVSARPPSDTNQTAPADRQSPPRPQFGQRHVAAPRVDASALSTHPAAFLKVRPLPSSTWAVADASNPRLYRQKSRLVEPSHKNELRVCAARSRRRNSVGRTRVGWSAMGISTRMHGNRIDHRGLSVPA
jgi:hypothetical protein